MYTFIVQQIIICKIRKIKIYTTVLTSEYSAALLKKCIGQRVYVCTDIQLSYIIQYIVQSLFIALYCAHMLYGLYTRFNKQLQFIKTVAFLVIPLNIELTYCFDRRSHAFMSGKKNNEYFRIKFSYLPYNLITINGMHQKVKKQYIILLITDSLDCLNRIIFGTDIKTDRTEIRLQRDGHYCIIIKR
ncbi:hypothetical protein SDC9_147310 [bioreactor metagenome]|uniref:Transmembrane protein n=1 Tax=bioreactor metagenome TaxID=1076179 RepID=A0A645EFC8_9ZZZZ